MSGNNNNNNAAVTTTVTTRSSKWLVWTPAISDMVIVLCLAAWCVVSTNNFNYWKDECPSRYQSGDDSDVCAYVRDCDASIHCRVDPNLHWIAGSLDTGTDCEGYECGEGECTCEVAGSLEGMYVCYMILFGLTALVEAFKFLLVLSAAMMSGCDPTENEPIEGTSLLTCMDSWTLLILRITIPRRFEQLMQAHDEGKVPVLTKTKLAQWAYRDFGCGLIITLYPIKMNFLNPWQIPLVLAMIVYILSLWRRSVWVDRQASNMRVLTQPPIVAMVEIHQQQQMESQHNTASATAEGS